MVGGAPLSWLVDKLGGFADKLGGFAQTGLRGFADAMVRRNLWTTPCGSPRLGDSGGMRNVALIGAGALGWAVGEILGSDPTGPRVVISDPAPPDPDLHPRAALAGSAGGALAQRLRQLGDRRRVGLVGHWSELDAVSPALTVVATSTAEPDRAITEHLNRHDLPHVLVRLSTRDVRVGPLVEPGRSPCLRCIDTLLADADPGWPDELFSRSSRSTPRSTDRVQVAWGAALTAVQVSCYLRSGRADTIGCTIELAADDLLTRVRRWPHHPECGCGWWHD